MSARKLLAGVGLGLVLGVATAAQAFAYTVAQGFAVSDFATGFDNGGGVGPVGLAFDSTRHLYVMDYHTGVLYKFGTSGGAASATTRINAVPIDGAPAGIAFSKDGRLYAALQATGKVIELNPTTGVVVRVVTSSTSGATGIATDPLSGDLFVTDPFGSHLYRLSGFADSTATVTTYATPFDPDGITFGADGTIYVASGGTAKKITGTDKSQPPTTTTIATVPSIDGIALAESSNPSNPSAIFGNRNDGRITKVDLTKSPPEQTDIVSEGTRGDFSQVGPDGCLYATQTASVAKVTNADGTCSFASTVSVPVLKLTPATQSASVGTSVTITATLTNATPASGHTVTFTVTGANPKVGTATTNASGTATFTYSGTHTGSDSISAATTANEQAVTSNAVTVTWTAAAPTPTPPAVLPRTGSGDPSFPALVLVALALMMMAGAGLILMAPRRR
jgi:sugar lactone lactonase YvrE